MGDFQNIIFPANGATILTPVSNAGGSVVSPSAVLLDDGRVLYVWCEFIGPVGGDFEIRQGHAVDADTFATTNLSVVFDKTLVTISTSAPGSRTGHGGACVSRGPDGNLYLAVNGRSTVNTFHANFDPWPGAASGAWFYRSVDEGVTWDYVSTFPTLTLVSGYSSWGTTNHPGELFVFPPGHPSAGRWLIVNAYNNFSGIVNLGCAVFYSDDQGGTWAASFTNMNLYNNGMARNFALWSDNKVYLHSYVSLGNSYLMNSVDGVSWVQYQALPGRVPPTAMNMYRTWNTNLSKTEHWTLDRTWQVHKAYINNPLSAVPPNPMDWTLTNDYAYNITNNPTPTLSMLQIAVVQEVGKYAAFMATHQLLAPEGGDESEEARTTAIISCPTPSGNENSFCFIVDWEACWTADAMPLQADGSVVSSVSDSSGNGHTMYSSALLTLPAAQPTYVVDDGNGYPAVQFVEDAGKAVTVLSVDTFGELGPPDIFGLTQPASVVLVMGVGHTALAQTGVGVISNSPTDAGAIRIDYDASGVPSFAAANGDGSIFAGGLGNLADRDHVHLAIAEFNDANTVLYMDGELMTSLGSPANMAGLLVQGFYINYAAPADPVNWYAMGVYHGILTANEKASLYNYARSRGMP